MRDFGTTIFAEMSALAQATGSVNLGQGFPDTDGPQELLEDAVEAIRGGANQYPPGRGVPALREAIARHQQHWYGLALDPDQQVMVTTGATEAIATAVLGLCEPGDEVVVIEPYYDSYAATIALAGAQRRSVALRPPHFLLDSEQLEAAFSDRTVMVLLNTPHNPTGRVLTVPELQLVADLAVRHDAVVVADEVYEHLVFGDGRHVPIATLPGMAERTLTIGSAGKTFSVTGWKIGWMTGPATLIDAALRVKQFLTFVSGSPFQPAVARALGSPDATFTARASDLGRRKDLLRTGLQDAGFGVLDAEAGYFLLADAAPLGGTDSVEFCRELPHRAGVVAIPVQVFCDEPEPVRSLVRFAFCKQDHVLVEAVERLQRLQRLG